MVVVTGGAGFIGSNIIKELNKQGINDIIVVDNLKNGYKFKQLVNSNISDYYHKNILCKKNGEIDCFLKNKLYEKITAVFHQGACSDTTNWDGRYMMENNFTCSKNILNFCIKYKIPFIYASSAATYGINSKFIEIEKYENPVNIYGYSKYLFDQYVRKVLPISNSQIVGLKYFNVYGPFESHKKKMSSVIYHNFCRIRKEKKNNINLFGSYGGYGPGEQMRDFIHVDDVVYINLWFLKNNKISGIFNCGTGNATTFNNVAKNILDYYNNNGTIDYIEFPEKLKKFYQSYTKANLKKLKMSGCDIKFLDTKDGIEKYLNWLENEKKFL